MTRRKGSIKSTAMCFIYWLSGTDSQYCGACFVCSGWKETVVGNGGDETLEICRIWHNKKETDPASNLFPARRRLIFIFLSSNLVANNKTKNKIVESTVDRWSTESIDILGELAPVRLNLTGVEIAPGPYSISPALYFTGKTYISLYFILNWLKFNFI